MKAGCFNRGATRAKLLATHPRPGRLRRREFTNDSTEQHAYFYNGQMEAGGQIIQPRLLLRRLHLRHPPTQTITSPLRTPTPTPSATRIASLKTFPWVGQSDPRLRRCWWHVHVLLVIRWLSHNHASTDNDVCCSYAHIAPTATNTVSTANSTTPTATPTHRPRRWTTNFCSEVPERCYNRVNFLK